MFQKKPGPPVTLGIGMSDKGENMALNLATLNENPAMLRSYPDSAMKADHTDLVTRQRLEPVMHFRDRKQSIERNAEPSR